MRGGFCWRVVGGRSRREGWEGSGKRSVGRRGSARLGLLLSGRGLGGAQLRTLSGMGIGGLRWLVARWKLGDNWSGRDFIAIGNFPASRFCGFAFCIVSM